MRRPASLLLVVATVAMFAVFPAGSAAAEPGSFNILAGFGQDTETLLSFFPRDITIRAGDTVTWHQNSDDGHNVAFLGAFSGPGGGSVFTPPGEAAVPVANFPFPGRGNLNYANPLREGPIPGPEVNGSTYRGGKYVTSGRMASIPQTLGVDPIYTFSLVFDTPGTYPYLCLTHVDTMFGTVQVAPASATDVPSPAAVEAQGQTELSNLQQVMRLARAQMEAPARSEPGPSGNTISYVNAGQTFFRLSDTRLSLDEFLPKDLTVTSGDTVVWTSNGFHAVTFNPSPIIPQVSILDSLPDGTVVRANNAEVFIPTKPTPVFDPTQYYVSGNLSNGQPGGTAWMLTFGTLGTFDYYCAVHRDRGMTGTITVVPK